MDTAARDAHRHAVRYGERWHARDRDVIHPLTVDQARARHETGELYTAVLGEGDEPVVVEVFLQDGYVGVRFVESHGRDGLFYAFRRQGERLFLTEAKVSTVGADGTVLRSEATMMEPDGTVQVRRVDRRTGLREVSAPTTSDVSMCWEEVPAFGDYASIARRDR